MLHVLQRKKNPLNIKSRCIYLNVTEQNLAFWETEQI